MKTMSSGHWCEAMRNRGAPGQSTFHGTWVGMSRGTARIINIWDFGSFMLERVCLVACCKAEDCAVAKSSVFSI